MVCFRVIVSFDTVSDQGGREGRRLYCYVCKKTKQHPWYGVSQNMNLYFFCVYNRLTLKFSSKSGFVILTLSPPHRFQYYTLLHLRLPIQGGAKEGC